MVEGGRETGLQTTDDRPETTECGEFEQKFAKDAKGEVNGAAGDSGYYIRRFRGGLPLRALRTRSKGVAARPTSPRL